MTELLGFEAPEEVKAAPGINFNYLHLITFPEVLTSKIPVVSIEGEMFGGPDRRIWRAAQVHELFLAWQRAIKKASVEPGIVPPEVMKYFVATQKLNKAPEEALALLNLEGKEVIIERVTLPKEEIQKMIDPPKTSTPKFSWSFTGLDCFFNVCPRKFAARWYYKTEIFEENEASIWGNRKHKADEMALKGQEEVTERGKVITLEKDIVDWKYVNAFLAAKAAGAELLVEAELCINRDLKQVGWWAQDAWGRAKTDVALIQGDTIKIYDWKTGKEKYEEWQLRIFCMFVALKYPQLKHFEARYIWLKEDKISDPVILNRTEILPILKDTLDKVQRIEVAWKDEIFQCKQNGLCKRYCGVQDCPHHGGKK
jgi:hypothetical protein